MGTFRLIVDKPSEAIRMMLDGLETLNENPRFVINMNTYGGKYNQSGNIIYRGCAATCAIITATGCSIAEGVRAHCYGIPLVSQPDCFKFMNAINDFRCGSYVRFLEYFAVPRKVINSIRCDIDISALDWCLLNYGNELYDDWKCHINTIRQVKLIIERHGY